jgi:hypothetical protein
VKQANLRHGVITIDPSEPLRALPGPAPPADPFQADYLGRLASDGATIVWAVTSANHENTKRNPVSYHRREAAIERLSPLTGLRSVVVPIFDTALTDAFAAVTLKTIAVATGLDLAPEDTVVACSTPQVAKLYEQLGFAIAQVEATRRCSPHRSGRGTCCCGWPGGDDSWRELAHPATVDVFERYQLVEAVRSVVNDPVPRQNSWHGL